MLPTLSPPVVTAGVSLYECTAGAAAFLFAGGVGFGLAMLMMMVVSLANGNDRLALALARGLLRVPVPLIAAGAVLAGVALALEGHVASSLWVRAPGVLGGFLAGAWFSMRAYERDRDAAGSF